MVVFVYPWYWKKRLRLLRKRVTKREIAPVRHGNAGRLPHHACKIDDVKDVVAFLRNYVENNAMVFPGKTQGIRDHRIMRFPGKRRNTFTNTMSLHALQKCESSN